MRKRPQFHHEQRSIVVKYVTSSNGARKDEPKPESMFMTLVDRPIESMVGAIVVGTTTAMAGGVLAGLGGYVAGVLVGAVMGAAGGAVGAQSVTAWIRREIDHDRRVDSYTTRRHVRPDASEVAKNNGSSPNNETKQAERESWNLLDQTNKELIIADTVEHSDGIGPG